MIGSISTALSGMIAATKRVDGSANNIANMSTPGYTPVTTIQSTDQSGGVMAENRRAEGKDQVDLSEEAINLKLAEISYKANISVLKVAEDMAEEAGRLLDKTV
jgi:flagellar hook-associated protein FlgK